MQAVLVSFNRGGKPFAYVWDDDAQGQYVVIGDRVKVPPNHYMPEDHWGTIVAYGRGGWRGDLVPIIECWRPPDDQ